MITHPRRDGQGDLRESSAEGIVVVVTGMPDWLVPMAATLTQERFRGPDWLFERKHDGIRLLAFRRGDDVRLYSRNHLPQELPAIAAAVAALPVREAILDGELD